MTASLKGRTVVHKPKKHMTTTVPYGSNNNETAEASRKPSPLGHGVSARTNNCLSMPTHPVLPFVAKERIYRRRALSVRHSKKNMNSDKPDIETIFEALERVLRDG